MIIFVFMKVDSSKKKKRGNAVRRSGRHARDVENMLQWQGCHVFYALLKRFRKNVARRVIAMRVLYMYATSTHMPRCAAQQRFIIYFFFQHPVLYA